MPIRYPPRREPRILAVARSPNGLAFAIADPWVIRGSGHADCSRRSEASAVRRIIRREKPTAVVSTDIDLLPAVQRAAETTSIPWLRSQVPKVPVVIASELYPELPLLAPGDLGPLAALAISYVLHSTIPPRSYAACRLRSALRRARAP